MKGADLSSLVLCSLNLSLYSEGWSILLGIKLRSAPTKSYKIASIQESGILFAKAKSGAEHSSFLLLHKELPEFDGFKQLLLLFYIFHGLGVWAQLSGGLSMVSQAAAVHRLPGTAFSFEAQGLLPSSRGG